MKVNGVNVTYEGLIPKVQNSILSKDPEALQPHVRAFVDRAVTFTTCPECGATWLGEAARSSRIGGINIADACAMQISDLAEWVRGVDEPSVAPLLAKLQNTLDSFVEIGLGYLCSTGRRARCRAARRSEASRFSTSAPRSPTSPTSSTSPPRVCTPMTSNA